MLHFKTLFEQLLLQIAPFNCLLVVNILVISHRVDILLIAFVLGHGSPSSMVAWAQASTLALS